LIEVAKHGVVEVDVFLDPRSILDGEKVNIMNGLVGFLPHVTLIDNSLL